MFLGGHGDRFTVFYVRTERLDYVLWSKNYLLSLNVRGPLEVTALSLTFWPSLGNSHVSLGSCDSGDGSESASEWCGQRNTG